MSSRKLRKYGSMDSLVQGDSNTNNNDTNELNLNNLPPLQHKPSLRTGKRTLYEAIKNINRELNVKIEKKEQNRVNVSLMSFLDKPEDMSCENNMGSNLSSHGQDPFSRKMSKKIDIDTVMGSLNSMMSEKEPEKKVEETVACVKEPVSPGTEEESKNSKINNNKRSGENITNKIISTNNPLNNSEAIAIEYNSENKKESEAEENKVVEENKVEENKVIDNEMIIKQSNSHTDLDILTCATDDREREIIHDLKKNNIILNENLQNSYKNQNASVVTVDLKKLLCLFKLKDDDIQSKEILIQNLYKEIELLKSDTESKLNTIKAQENKNLELEKENKLKVKELDYHLKASQNHIIKIEKENVILKNELSNAIKNKVVGNRKLNDEISEIEKMTKEFFDNYVSTSTENMEYNEECYSGENDAENNVDNNQQ